MATKTATEPVVTSNPLGYKDIPGTTAKAATRVMKDGSTVLYLRLVTYPEGKKTTKKDGTPGKPILFDSIGTGFHAENLPKDMEVALPGRIRVSGLYGYSETSSNGPVTTEKIIGSIATMNKADTAKLLAALQKQLTAGNDGDDE